jgi:hypothetical protein
LINAFLLLIEIIATEIPVNCEHCHSERRAANTSDLYLDISTKQKIRRGECKLSVAADQGTESNKFLIAPNEPEESIQIYRIPSINPGEIMRELGRSLIHDEDIALISG